MRLVIKHGGSVHGSGDAVLKAIAGYGGDVVVVHGAGPQITHALAQAGVPSAFVDGLRVTPARAMPIVVSVLEDAGAALVRELERLGRGAARIDDRFGGMLECSHATGTRGEDLGHVAHAVSAQPRAIESLWQAGITPVVSPLGFVSGVGTCNINADEVAGCIAGALGAPAIFVTDVPGVAIGGVVRARLTLADIERAVTDGSISGGMIPKTAACAAALRMGAPYAAIVPASDEVLDEQAGTHIVAANARSAA